MKYAKYILILALLAASGACTNDFEDYNTNPNKQSEGSVAPIALLEPLIYSSTNSYSSYMLSIANEISQVTVAKSTPRREHCYNLADGNFKAIWNLGYKWAGNAKHMYDLAVAQNQPNFQAIGLTLKVYNMSILTDMFGSIAYREALKGGEGINTPHIDSQQEVYTAMLEELELANSLYLAGRGIRMHDLAMRIFHSDGPVELDEADVQLLKEFAQTLSPAFIDSLDQNLGSEAEK